MIDIRTQYVNELMRGDMALLDGILAQDQSLDTAIIISLFTDRRARPEDKLPDNSKSLRGWWGDLLSYVQGDEIGSFWWLLRREKNTRDTANRARDYALQALQWLIDDGIATKVEVDAEPLRRQVLGVQIRVYLIDGDLWQRSFELQVEAAA